MSIKEYIDKAIVLDTNIALAHSNGDTTAAKEMIEEFRNMMYEMRDNLDAFDCMVAIKLIKGIIEYKED